MKVEVWSDIGCPFCFIGKRNFEAALKNFAHGSEVEIVMKSFELDPYAKNNTGLTTYQMLSNKYSMSLEQAKQMTESVAQRGKEAGLIFNFDKAIHANTFDAHRLLHFAKTQDKQLELQEKLFAAHFTEGMDVGDKGTLIQLATEAGLLKIDVENVLTTEAFRNEVRHDENQAKELGLNGVPAFLIDNKYLVSGAQPVKVFLDALNKAWENKA